MSDDGLIGEAVKYEKSLLNFFWRQGVPYHDGKDLVQQTYLRVWKYRERYSPGAKLSTFLFMIARQVRIDDLRRRTRREKREDAYVAQSEVASSIRGEMDEGSEEDRLVRHAVWNLSDPLREVVELAVFQRMPYSEVAEVLGIPVGTVKSRMHNALRKLKEAMDDGRS